MADETKPAVIISRGNIVLVYVYGNDLMRRIYTYGASLWEDAQVLLEGNHPQMADQANLLWLVWERNSIIYFATSSDGGRNFVAASALAFAGSTPSVVVLPSGFVGIAFVSAGAIRLTTEEDNFSTVTNIASYSVIPDRVVLRRWSSRLICGWIEDEEALVTYSNDAGTTWSTSISLGDATGLDINCDLPSDHIVALVEYSHLTYGIISRTGGTTWDDRWLVWQPEASIDPAFLLDSVRDAVVFSGVLDVSIPLHHEYRVRLINAPLFAYVSEVLDLGSVVLGAADWHVLPDWFYWGPRANLKFDLRSGNTETPDDTWTDWEEAFDAQEWHVSLGRYMQHRFYAHVPHDVRESRDLPVLPEFIYRLFNLKWWGVKPYYMYYPNYSWYSYYDTHYWGDDVTISGWQQYVAQDREPVLDDSDLLPIYEV